MNDMDLEDLCACSPVDDFGWPTSDEHTCSGHGQLLIVPLNPDEPSRMIAEACGVLGCVCEEFRAMLKHVAKLAYQEGKQTGQQEAGG